MDFLEFIRKVAKERKEQWIAKHYGPGPHPSGSPQSVHGGKGRKGKARAGAKAKKRKQPPDMSKWSKTQHAKAINSLAKKPLKELRRRQGLVVSQRKQALQQLKRTKDSAIKQRLERGLRNLDVMDKHLIAAIDKKEFG